MKKLLILMFAILISTVGVNIAKAYEIGDPDDVFYVTAPTANQKVSGTINISWRMWDDDQATIQYTAKLFDAASCENVNYGTINSNLSGTSNKNSDNSLAWNTNNTLSSTNLPDGNYCLQVCAAMKNGSSAQYSACNSRIVKIVNHNTLPVITSNPTNLTIKESAAWSYQVTAYDADNDALNYNLIYGTSFLTINPQTGLIQTNGTSKALPTGVNQANYQIGVTVNDGISGSASQEFTLSIVRDNPIVTPPVTNPPTTNPPTQPEQPTEPTDETTNHPTKIDIVYPSDNSILSGADNQLKWDITDQDGLKKITLEYSTDNDKNWKLIKTLQTDQELTFNSYTWDVTDIEDNVYYLKFTVVDKKDAQVNRVSDNFLIKNSSDETQSQPLIINLSPESSSEIKDNTPTLSAEFVPSNTSKVLTETVKIILNDVDITSKCKTSEKGFSCEITQALEDGKHSVNVSYKDSDGKIASLNWTFSINTKAEEQTLTQDTVVILGNSIPRNSLLILVGLCCVLIILIVIPWVLYRNWKKSRGKTETVVEYGGGFTPNQTVNNYSNLGSFAPVGEPIVTQPAQIQTQTMEPAVQNPQTPDQQAIEQSLMEYWKGQGQPPVDTSYPMPEVAQQTYTQPVAQTAPQPMTQPEVQPIVEQIPQPDQNQMTVEPVEPIAPVQQQPAQTGQPAYTAPDDNAPYPIQPFQEISPEQAAPDQAPPANGQPLVPEDTTFMEPTPTDNQ